jgi:sterol desaturase/sphingolipid hydroxylase (fatty acid hydroxylase superfamily)
VAIPALAFVITYYLSAIVQTIAHRLFGHTKRVMAIYAEHTHGHHARYARSDLLRDDWVPSERHVLWYFAIPFAAIAAVVWAMAPFAVLIAYVAGLIFSFALHLLLHRQYHVRGSLLERFAWFRRKRALHFIHHRRVRTNYAIVENWIDRLLGTYRAT